MKIEQMKLTFVNVGYGEAILLEIPEASRRDGIFTALIDGGSADRQEYEDRSSGRIPVWDYLQKEHIGHLDLMVCTHIHEDHVSGMRKAAQILPPGELWQTLPVSFYENMRDLDPAAARNLSQDKFLRALNDYRELCVQTVEHGGFIRKVDCGQTMFLGGDGYLEALAPSEREQSELEEAMAELFAESETGRFLQKLSELDRRMNNYSLILRIVYQDRCVLLPGDTNARGYAGIPQEKLQADLFKIGHHGQKDGISGELLKIISPEAVVCCASSDRRYDSAHPDVVRMLEDMGIRPYFSDCPPTANGEIPPHRALRFIVSREHPMTGEYIS